MLNFPISRSRYHFSVFSLTTSTLPVVRVVWRGTLRCLVLTVVEQLFTSPSYIYSCLRENPLWPKDLWPSPVSFVLEVGSTIVFCVDIIENKWKEFPGLFSKSLIKVCQIVYQNSIYNSFLVFSPKYIL